MVQDDVGFVMLWDSGLYRIGYYGAEHYGTQDPMGLKTL